MGLGRAGKTLESQLLLGLEVSRQAPNIPGPMEWTRLLTASLSLSLGFPHLLQGLFFFLSFHFFPFLS